MKKIYLVAFMFGVSFAQLNATPNSEKHVVKKGETLYSISRAHGIKVADLMKANPSLNTHLKPGQMIALPSNKVKPELAKNDIQEKAHTTKVVKPAAVSSTPNIAYKEEDDRTRINVPAAETEAAVATINNDAPVMEKPKVIAESAPAFTLRTSSANVAEYSSIFGNYSSHGIRPKINRGAAVYLADNTSGNPYLALYSGAEMGSIIKVTNLMSKRTVYVKVVGKVPPMDASKEVILKLSHNAAHDLGAIDEKFLVEVAGCEGN